MLLEIGDSVMTHRRRYAVSSGPTSAIDLLVLDPLNPRSVLFQVSTLREQLEMLPGGMHEGQRSAAAKAALLIETGLLVADPEAIDTDRLFELSREIGRIADLVGDAYFV
jgi:uncharacterized alpha-E superfamily protein